MEGALTGPRLIGRMRGAFDAFFFAPRDSRLPDLIRVGCAALLLINVLVLGLDLERWFAEDGVLPFAASRLIVDPDTLTLFAWLPRTHAVLWGAYLLLVAHLVLLLAGVLPRLQAACAFVWLVSFQHRHIMLFDGEDTVFRLMCFFLIVLPTGRHYVPGRRNPAPATHPGWALRLVQIQVCLIYLSSAWEKAIGRDWPGGTAIYYVARLDDVFGTLPLPHIVFEWMPAVRVASWTVVVLEFALPVTLWFKDLRRGSLIIALLFHAATDYAMNLFLFHWIMAVALLSFCESRDLEDVKALVAGVRGRLRRRPTPGDRAGRAAPDLAGAGSTADTASGGAERRLNR